MQKRGQKKGSAVIDAGVATVQGSHWRAKSDQNPKSVWTAAVHRKSALALQARRRGWVANVPGREHQVTYIVLSEQMERAEHLVVFEVE